MSLRRGFVRSGVCNSQGQQAVTHKWPASAALLPVRSGPCEGTRRCLPCVPGHEPTLRSGRFRVAAVELFAGDRAAEELEGCPGCGPLPIAGTEGLKLPSFA